MTYKGVYISSFKNIFGVWVLSCDMGKMQYIGYTKKEALLNFKRLITEAKNNKRRYF